MMPALKICFFELDYELFSFFALKMAIILKVFIHYDSLNTNSDYHNFINLMC